MTDSDWQIIERVAKIYGFTIHEGDPEYNLARRITDKADINCSSFYWNENEGFDEFFNQVHQYAYECGVDSATIRGW